MTTFLDYCCDLLMGPPAPPERPANGPGQSPPLPGVDPDEWEWVPDEGRGTEG